MTETPPWPSRLDPAPVVEYATTTDLCAIGPSYDDWSPVVYMRVRSGSAETLDSLGSDLARIDALSRLGQDWDSYGAEAPNAEAIGWAKKITRLADAVGIRPTAIVASAESGIGIAFKRDGRYADIEAFNAGDILALTSDGTGTPHVWTVERSDSGIAQALKAIRDYLQ